MSHVHKHQLIGLYSQITFRLALAFAHVYSDWNCGEAIRVAPTRGKCPKMAVESC